MTGLRWEVAGEVLSLEAPLLMGILNLTPDSFSDGGELPGIDSALRRAEEMIGDGAAILDLGGESTRPGAPEVSESEELRRVLPVLEALRARFPTPLSIDTRKARVAREAILRGAAIVNDVSALAHDPAMAQEAAEGGVGVVLMHMRGTPETMRDQARYEAIEEEVARELGESVARAESAGIRREAIVLDPGIGFAKTGAQSLRLLGRLGPLLALGLPLLVGPSRKSFIGELLGLPPRERAVGSAAACVMAYLAGARIFRVHDVGVAAQALRVAAAIAAEGKESREHDRGPQEADSVRKAR